MKIYLFFIMLFLVMFTTTKAQIYVWQIPTVSSLPVEIDTTIVGQDTTFTDLNLRKHAIYNGKLWRNGNWTGKSNVVDATTINGWFLYGDTSSLIVNGTPLNINSLIPKGYVDTLKSDTASITKARMGTLTVTDSVITPKVAANGDADLNLSARTGYTYINLGDGVINFFTDGHLAYFDANLFKLPDSFYAPIGRLGILNLNGTRVTSTAAQLNYLSGATGTTGTTTTNLVYSTSPTLVTPEIGAATGTSLSLSGSSGNTLALETSGLVYDATNNRVGIGTASPLYPLEIATTAQTANSVFLSLSPNAVADGYGASIDFRTATATTANRYVARITGIREGAGALASLAFSTETGSALTEKMRITSGGNVGIGDASPASMLTVGSGDLFQVNSSGQFVKINNITPEGQCAVPIIVDTVSRTTASTIAATNFVGAATAGLYEVGGYVECTTGSAGVTATVTLGWTDAVGATSSTPINLFAMTTTGRTSFSPVPIKLASGNITWTYTVSGASTVSNLYLYARRIY